MVGLGQDSTSYWLPFATQIRYCKRGFVQSRVTRATQTHRPDCASVHYFRFAMRSFPSHQSDHNTSQQRSVPVEGLAAIQLHKNVTASRRSCAMWRRSQSGNHGRHIKQHRVLTTFTVYSGSVLSSPYIHNTHYFRIRSAILHCRQLLRLTS